MVGIIAGLLAGCGALLITVGVVGHSGPVPTRHHWIRIMLTHAGVGQTSPQAFFAMSAGVGLAVMLIFLGVSHTWTISVALGLLASAIPLLILQSRARRHLREVRHVWPEAVDTLVSAVRAGMSLPEALARLGERGPEPVREDFQAFAHDYATTARFEDSLLHLKARLADPIADRIIGALLLAHDVGGHDLGIMLESLARMLRDDLRTRGELEARQSWTVNGARVAVAAPWIILMLLATRPEAASAYASTTGALVLAIGAGVSILAYRLMLILGRLPHEERVLA